MILLSILLTPLGIAVLFVVMYRTERALDDQDRRQPSSTTNILTAATIADGRAVVDIAALTEPVVAK